MAPNELVILVGFMLVARGVGPSTATLVGIVLLVGAGIYGLTS